MTCGQLAELFAAQPADRPATLSIDGDTAPVAEACEAMYVPHRHLLTGDLYDTPEEAGRIADEGGVAAPAPPGAVRVFSLASEI